METLSLIHGQVERTSYTGMHDMTPVTVRNVTETPVFVPARGDLAVVLRPGEASTVCPETLRGEGALTDLLARGVVSTIGGHKIIPFVWTNHDYDTAA